MHILKVPEESIKRICIRFEMKHNGGLHPHIDDTVYGSYRKHIVYGLNWSLGKVERLCLVQR